MTEASVTYATQRDLDKVLIEANSLFVYFYSDVELGIRWHGPDADRDRHGDFPEPRFNWCAFPSFRQTRNPDKADIFVVRPRLSHMPRERIYELPYLKGNEGRHVFFDLADYYETYPEFDALFIRAATTKQMLKVNPTAIAWPWPTEDFGKHMPTPAGGWQYDVSFMGQANDIAKDAMRSIGTAGLSTWFQVNSTFWPHICDADPEAGKDLRTIFLNNMQAGRLSLCPMTLDGVIRYRFYEAMSMARVNVLLCDNCVLPLRDKIDYSRCVITIPQALASEAGDMLKAWLDSHSDEEIWQMGLYARQMWITWLWRGRWAEVVDQIVREKLAL